MTTMISRSYLIPFLPRRHSIGFQKTKSLAWIQRLSPRVYPQHYPKRRLSNPYHDVNRIISHRRMKKNSLRTLACPGCHRSHHHCPDPFHLKTRDTLLLQRNCWPPVKIRATKAADVNVV